MIARLNVPFRDTSADDLSLTLAFEDVPARPALAELCIPIAGMQIEIRVLAGSHEARIVGGGVRLSEVVGCDEVSPHGLPPVLEHPLTAGRYVFRAETRRLGASGFDAMAQDLVAQLGSDPQGLVGRFPGHPNALTGLATCADDTGIGWTTWHLYPSHCELVRTDSRVTLR